MIDTEDSESNEDLRRKKSYDFGFGFSVCKRKIERRGVRHAIPRAPLSKLKINFLFSLLFHSKLN